MSKSALTQVTQCIALIRSAGAEPRYLYCNRAFHDAMLDELNGSLRITSARNGPAERIDSFNGLAVVITSDHGAAGAIVTADPLPL